jgi:hypothetical protein
VKGGVGLMHAAFSVICPVLGKPSRDPDLMRLRGAH